MSAATSLTLLLLLPMGASPLVYLAGRLIVRAKGESDKPNPIWILALIVLLATCVPLYYAGKATLAVGSISVLRGTIPLRMDGISLLLAAVSLVIGIVVILFSVRYMAAEIGGEKFYALVLALVAAMTGLGCAADLFNLWVWFEAMAIIALLLVTFYRDEPGAIEAGIKYLVQSAVGSILILLGIALVFLHTGALDLTAIRASVQGSTPVLLAAGALMVIGFGIKTALVPLHTWLPDAHSQAPSGISALLSGVLIEAALIAMLRALSSIIATSSMWGTLLLAFGAANMLLGNLMALRQTQVKRMLAYSSISHVGYMLLGFGVAVSFGQASGAAGGFFHLITHALMKSLAFLAAGSLLYALHLAKDNHEPLVLDDLNGAARRYPWVALCLSVAVLGLAGLPPMAGFMSKWQILAAGIQTHSTAILVLVVFMVLNSILSLGYYAPLVNRMYRRSISPLVQTGAAIEWTMMLPLILLTVVVLVLGCYPGLLNWLTNAAASGLMTALGH
ncbi:MAG: complex I subunit 5 family protein [Anaerolineae bacterium]